MSKTKQKKDTADAVAAFVPSTGDESYLQSLPSDITLDELGTMINSSYSAGITLAQKATAEMMKCGEYLQVARKKFKGDKEFGQWRKKHVNFSQSHCARLMAVSKEFGNNEDAQMLPISTLSELLPALPEVKEAVIEKVKSGEKVTRKDVKEMKNTARPQEGCNDLVDEPVPVATKPVRQDKTTTPAKGIDFVAEAQVKLEQPFLERLAENEVRGADDAQFNAFIIFGLPPYGEGIPSKDTISALYAYYNVETPDGDAKHKFTAAYDILMAMYD